PGPGGSPLPPPTPPPPPKPNTRPDYVNTLEALRSEFRNTPASRRGKLLDKADETFARLGHPQTPEEHAVLCGAWEMYSTVDEMLRFRPGRENARKQYEAAAEARRAAKEEEARQQRQRQEAEEQRKREQEEQSAKLARDQEQRQRETAARTEKLKKELDAICVSLVKAMILSAESGDGQQLADALASADNYIISSECDTPAERQLIAQFQALKRGVKGAGDAYGKFIASCAQFQSRGLFMVGRNTLAKLTGIRTNGDVTYVTTRNVQGVFRPETEKQRAQLLKHLMKNTSLPPVTAFYYGLMTRHVTPDVEKQAPSPFWKNALRFYREAFLK
ncbi:MAG: hypothetical protein IJS01_11855, partial [Lentisphaeria bacterium]|nr:hypothetical protein [Lentisphaeria bacterium]